MKQKYDTPLVEVIEIFTADIICTSGGGDTVTIPDLEGGWSDED